MTHYQRDVACRVLAVLQLLVDPYSGQQSQMGPIAYMAAPYNGQSSLCRAVSDVLGVPVAAIQNAIQLLGRTGYVQPGGPRTSEPRWVRMGVTFEVAD